MKTYLLISNLILSSHLAIAAVVDDQDQLWQQVEAERAYKPVSLQSAGITGDIEGFLMPGGLLKLYQIGSDLQTRGQLLSTEFQNYPTEERYRMICDVGTARFPDIRDEKHPYQLKFKIFPMRQNQSLVVTDANGESWNATQLNTKFQPVEFIKPIVTASSDALIFQTGLNQDKIAKLIVAQIQNQLTLVQQTGELTVDLTSYDDVACDLIEGKLNIQVQVSVHYDSPKVTRFPRLSAGQLGGIYEKAKSLWPSQPTSDQAKILGGYTIAVASGAANLDSGYFSAYEVLRLFGLLFDVNQGTLKNLSAADYQPTALLMDRLSGGDAWSVSAYKVNVDVPAFGKSRGR